jgi:2-enoate reductase
LRGHKVRLYEKTARLGGVFIAATLPDFKEADRKLLRWYLKEIRDLNIEVHLNSEITPRMLPSLTAQEVIIATGAKPRYLPGIDINRHKIWEAIDFLEQGGDVAPGNAVVIGGGVTGCEIAYDLARKGHNVALVEMVDDILRVPDLCAANSAMLRTLLDHYHVAVYTSARISDVTPSGVIIMQGGETHVLLADIIITSIGYNSDKTLAIRAGDDPHVHVIGDAAQVGNVLGAIWDANDTALALSLTE